MDRDQLLALLAQARANNPALLQADIDAFVREESGGKFASEAALSAPVPSRAEALGRGALQGASFSFADELAAGIRALGPGTYAEEIKKSRSKDRAAREAHGKTFLLGELAGGVAVPGLGGARLGMAGAKSVGSLALRGAGTGLLEGGLYGAGAAEEGGRVGGAVVGAGLGTVGGALLGPAAVGLGNVARRSLGKVVPGLERAGSGGAEIAGRRRIARSLDESDLVKAQSNIRALEAAAPGQSVVADASRKTQRLLRAAANRSDAAEELARDALLPRRGGATARLAEALPVSGVRLDGYREALQGRVAEAGKRLFGPLDEALGEIDLNPKLREFVDEFQGLTETFDPKDVESLLRVPRIGRLLRGGRGLVDEPNVFRLGDFQDLRGRLFDVGERLKRTGETNESRKYFSLAQKLTDALEETVPGYRAANKRYFQLNEAVRALDVGKDIAGGTWRPYEVTKELERLRREGGVLAEMNAKAGYLAEMSDALLSRKITPEGIHQWAKMSPYHKQVLTSMFKDQASGEAWLRKALAESNMDRTAVELTGNSTTAKQLIDALGGGETTTPYAFTGPKAATTQGMVYLLNRLIGLGRGKAATNTARELLKPGRGLLDLNLSSPYAKILTGDRTPWYGIGTRGAAASGGVLAGGLLNR